MNTREKETVDDAIKSDLERIKGKAQDARDNVNDLAVESLEALRNAVDELSAQVKANASSARDLSLTKLNDLSEAVRRNPLPSVAIAAGLGLIVGLWRHGDIARTVNR